MIVDVLVAGVGPAGSTAAALLAEAGFDVVVLEKQAFPRPKIGESLLPAGLPVLERLGIEVTNNFVHKRGAEFVCERTGRRRLIDFRDALDGPPRHAWQVDRAGFDEQLCSAAQARGAEVRFQTKAVSMMVTDKAVEVAVRKPGERNTEMLRARYVIDASGQDRWLARHQRSAVPLHGFGQSAAYAHFTGVDLRVWDEDIAPHHDIRIMMVPNGWGWVIPLAGRRLSVGLVLREGDATKAFSDHLKGSALLQKWTRGTEASPICSVRNYSFRNRCAYGARYVCVGDAACFLDPVFSSGVSLALTNASDVADRLIPALRQNTEGDPSLMDEHERWMEAGYRTFSAVIDRFYNTNFVDHFIFGELKGDESITRGIVSILAGDVWRDDNPIQPLLLRSRRPRVTAEAGL